MIRRHKAIEKFVSFIGPVRTGHSLVASILDAHPNMAVSLNTNPFLRFIDGYSRKEMFNIIFQYCEDSRRRKKGGYKYFIKGTTQSETKVLGDSMSTQKNAITFTNDKLFKKFCDYIGTPIYWFWVVRNPFENIQSGSSISGNDINHMLKLYTERIHMTHEFYKKNKNRVFIIHLEKLILDPDHWISQMLNFLEMPINDEYLDICSDFIFSKPHKVFCRDDWTDEQIDKINNLIKIIPELNCYSMEEK